LRLRLAKRLNLIEKKTHLLLHVSKSAKDHEMKASLGFKLLLVVSIGSFCNAEDVDINKMTMKEIKRELAARGQQCRGCLEKADFVELL
jgi:hypothetical protein